MSEHIHEWKRLPIVSLSVTYLCACSEARTMFWTGMASQNLEVLDAEFVKYHGGTFAGETHPPGRSQGTDDNLRGTP